MANHKELYQYVRTYLRWQIACWKWCGEEIERHLPQEMAIVLFGALSSALIAFLNGQPWLASLGFGALGGIGGMLGIVIFHDVVAASQVWKECDAERAKLIEKRGDLLTRVKVADIAASEFERESTTHMFSWILDCIPGTPEDVSQWSRMFHDWINDVHSRLGAVSEVAAIAFGGPTDMVECPYQELRQEGMRRKRLLEDILRRAGGNVGERLAKRENPDTTGGPDLQQGFF